MEILNYIHLHNAYFKMEINFRKKKKVEMCYGYGTLSKPFQDFCSLSQKIIYCYQIQMFRIQIIYINCHQLKSLTPSKVIFTKADGTSTKLYHIYVRIS